MNSDEGYAALALSILLPCPPDLAFIRLEGRRTKRVTPEEIEDMVKLKSEHSYPELSEMFGLSQQHICKMIKTHTG